MRDRWNEETVIGKYSCGPERTCGASDCRSCYPGGETVRVCPHCDRDDENCECDACDNCGELTAECECCKGCGNLHDACECETEEGHDAD